MTAKQAGLMSDSNPRRKEMMDLIRKAFGPIAVKPRTLEERLEALPADKLEFVMNIASYVKIASGFNKDRSYKEVVDSMYRTLDPTLRKLIADMLQEADPILEPTVVKPDPRVVAREQIIKDYDSMLPLFSPKEAAPETQELDKENEALPSLKEFNATPDSFMQRMAISESSGRPDAEITLEDGRTFTGLYQFGDARLSDYRKATGAKFTTDQFKQDAALQERVAKWHFKDLEQAIDELGEDAKGYDRGGLKAVGHLGGRSGMQKFVRSNGAYDPSDALGTSLSDYYKKFSS